MNILDLSIHSQGKDPRTEWYVMFRDQDSHLDPLPHLYVLIEYVGRDNIVRRGFTTFINENYTAVELAYPIHPRSLIRCDHCPIRNVVMWRYLDKDNNPVPIQR